MRNNSKNGHQLEDIDQIGPYRLVHFVGRGGMAEVWSAVRPDLQAAYAIKVMHPELSRSSEHVDMFYREARIAAQLGRHTGIVRVHDMGSHESLLYLVMDLVDGVNLSRFDKEFRKTRKEPMSLSLVVYIVQQLLRALGAAHGHHIGGRTAGVVHGDVKPGNLLISSAGEVQLSDFGIAKFAALTPWVSKPVGTLVYMAPEQYLGCVTTVSDLYAAGALLHRLLSGRPPSPETRDPAAFQVALMTAPTPPTGRNDIPPELERLRLGLLEKNDRNRIQTAAEALAILQTLAVGDPQSELSVAYERVIGPARSGLTKFLQTCSDGEASFLAQLVRPPVRFTPSAGPDDETRTSRPPRDPNGPETDAAVPIKRVGAGPLPAASPLGIESVSDDEATTQFRGAPVTTTARLPDDGIAGPAAPRGVGQDRAASDPAARRESTTPGGIRQSARLFLVAIVLGLALGVLWPWLLGQL